MIRSSTALRRTSMEAEQGRWKLDPHLILRMAGFAIEELDPLVPADMRRRLADLEEATGALLLRRGELLARLGRLRREAGSPAAVSRGRRIERYVRRNRGVSDRPFHPELAPLLAEWNRCVERVARCLDSCWACRTAGEDGIRDTLRQKARTGPFLEAVFVNSPGALEGVLEYAKSGRAAQRQLITGYAQRFSGKAETASFYGPSNFIDATSDGGPEIRFDQRKSGEHARRRVAMSYWAAQAIADSLRSRTIPNAHHRLYRDARISTAGLAESCKSQLEAAVLTAADGRDSIAHLARRLGLSTNQVLPVVDALQGRGLLQTGLRLPTACAEPLTALTELVKDEDL
jgi:hypothetical protein